MERRIPREKSGFIVHPWETADGKYSSSYGNHNRTAKNFKTLRLAKAYLIKNKIKEAVYDSPSGEKTILLKKVKKRR